MARNKGSRNARTVPSSKNTTTCTAPLTQLSKPPQPHHNKNRPSALPLRTLQAHSKPVHRSIPLLYSELLISEPAISDCAAVITSRHGAHITPPRILSTTGEKRNNIYL
ncbi:hypothetical protein M758_4G185500 [Ceratodon purpureus]|uniref:Uncharacterized protein n=1 Tax=Ceratodon purpureus TaxID=3225 RepID=A0A8T0IC53_CERPU|nr:hypothetical protein KC19_4G182900 [Ceratodon purpureus]KAG0620053.1 hypothetical protein M758_4G185500 [Ceratodon purpureus]